MVELELDSADVANTRNKIFCKTPQAARQQDVTILVAIGKKERKQKGTLKIESKNFILLG